MLYRYLQLLNFSIRLSSEGDCLLCRGGAMARTPRGASLMVTARAYTSPTLVLLAMDWPAGKRFADFLGFAILRSPGFNPREKYGFLFNKIGFDPPGPNSQPLPSSLAPFQKFLWWDG